MAEHAVAIPSLDHERTLRLDGHRFVAGVDEVGRGSWAGPVVAAAVILPPDDRIGALAGARDSKQLSPVQREDLAQIIMRTCLAVGIGWASHHVIDAAGIGAANRRALLRAIRNLPVQADALVVDYFRLPESGLPQVCIPHGEGESLSVAAASIVAKVTRDRWMAAVERRVPGYGFAQNKGYGTPEHRRALEALGPSRLHRRSFQPVARCIA